MKTAAKLLRIIDGLHIALELPDGVTIQTADVIAVCEENAALRSKLNCCTMPLPNIQDLVEARAEVERLRADAARYQWIRGQHIQMSSPKMDGQHRWRFRCNIRCTGGTPDEAIDKEMEEAAFINPNPSEAR